MGAREIRMSVMLGLCVWLTACDPYVEGNFAWKGTDDRGIEEPERTWLVETEFRIARDQLYFFDYETIWWVYQITDGHFEDDQFLAALYEDNLTPDPVLVDLRRVTLIKDGCCSYIRQYYEQLPPGRYLLKIAHKSNAVDMVRFTVVPAEGPRGMGTPESFEDDVESEEDFDEILRYSG